MTQSQQHEIAQSGAAWRWAVAAVAVLACAAAGWRWFLAREAADAAADRDGPLPAVDASSTPDPMSIVRTSPDGVEPDPTPLPLPATLEEYLFRPRPSLSPDERRREEVQRRNSEENYLRRQIERLKGETFETSLRLAFGWGETIRMPLRGDLLFPDDLPFGRKGDRLIAVSRRFAKLADFLLHGDYATGQKARALAEGIDYFLDARRRAVEQLDGLLAEARARGQWPFGGAATFDDPQSAPSRINALFTGIGLTNGSMPPDPNGPLPFGSTSAGITAHLMLLNMLPTPETLPSHYRIWNAAQNDPLAAWREQLRDVPKESDLRRVTDHLSVQLPIVWPHFLADAFDRVLTRPDCPLHAEYMAWRAANAPDLPQRQTVYLERWTAPHRPDEPSTLPQSPDAIPYELALPHQSLNESVREGIFDFARRLRALSGGAR